MIDESKLVEGYDRLNNTILEMISDGLSPIQVAPLLVKLGLSIYKTCLSDEDYQKMVDFISDNRDEIDNSNSGMTQ
jgi:hypothetical protein